MTTLNLIETFLALQERRAATYNTLHDSFRHMVEAKRDEEFIESVPEWTRVFSEISKEVIGVETELNRVGDKQGQEVARLIRTVQINERQKLAATSQLHALRKSYEFGEFLWQQLPATETLPDHLKEHEFRQKIKESTRDLESSIDQINDALDEIRCIKLDLSLEHSPSL